MSRETKPVAINVLIGIQSYAELAQLIADSAPSDADGDLAEEIALWRAFADALGAFWAEWIGRFGIERGEYERELARAERSAARD